MLQVILIQSNWLSLMNILVDQYCTEKNVNIPEGAQRCTCTFWCSKLLHKTQVIKLQKASTINVKQHIFIAISLTNMQANDSPLLNTVSANHLQWQLLLWAESLSGCRGNSGEGGRDGSEAQ